MNKERYFYSVLKNEDATPYIGENVIIAADGLGGAGCTVHNVTGAEGTTLHDEIFKAAFGDFDAEAAKGLSEYLEHWVEPMADGKPDTSALWGSRIAIARCAYALCFDKNFDGADLADKKTREKLSEFISKGLENTRKHFKLEKGKYDNQKILPTTLAFIRYKTDADGVTAAEVVWAGDSRCYLLTEKGLKLLSVDDEDGSGAITNLFCVDGKNPAVLNYRKYEIKGPCVLMAVSDGLFDPFDPHDNLGVEKTLLEHIFKNDSYERLMQSLSAFYDEVHGDDATMAFVPVGFADYKALQDGLQGRAALIAEVWKKLENLHDAMEVADSPEEEAREYVETRTRDKFDAVLSEIKAGYYAHSSDLIFSDGLFKIISDGQTAIAERKKREKEERKEHALECLHSYMENHIDENPENFLAPLTTDVPHDIFSVISELKTVFNAITVALKKREEENRSAQRLADERADKLKDIIARQQYYWQEYNDLRGDPSQKDRWEAAAKKLIKWLNIEKTFARNFYDKSVHFTEKPDKEIYKNIVNFVLKNKKELNKPPKGAETEIYDQKARYLKTLNKLFELLQKSPTLYEKIFNKKTIAAFNLNGSEEGGADESGADITEVLTSDKEAVIKAVVDALAENCRKTSVLDKIYNHTRLEKFRIYYDMKTNPVNGITEFKERLKELEAEYESYLAPLTK